jgi:hypothetical protein
MKRGTRNEGDSSRMRCESRMPSLDCKRQSIPFSLLNGQAGSFPQQVAPAEESAR